MAYPTRAYTFTNATTADATQVNANNTNWENGLSDGTKDFSMNDGTLAGDLACVDIAASGKVVGGVAAAVVGDNDALDVSGANVVACLTVGNIKIGGLVGGVAGQVLQIVHLDTANDLTLEYVEGTGNQDIYTKTGADETLTAEYGGWTLVCNGSNWFAINSH